MASTCSGATTTLIWAEWKTAPRNEINWLGNSELLAKLTLSPRHSKWLRRRDLWDSSSAGSEANSSMQQRSLA